MARDTFRHGERERGLARAAYQTFEPLHLVAYFGPAVDAAREELGIGWLGSYAGMRAAPLGPVPGSVVAATFYGFHPRAVDKAWRLALGAHDPAAYDALRTRVVDTGLRSHLGELLGSPELARQAERMRAVIERADLGGRALAASYAALPWPDEPHLALWHAATLWREWRGDAHNAALVAHGLPPVDALVLYDAWLPAERAAQGRGGHSSSRPASGPTRSGSRRRTGSPTSGWCGPSRSRRSRRAGPRRPPRRAGTCATPSRTPPTTRPPRCGSASTTPRICWPPSGPSPRRSSSPASSPGRPRRADNRTKGRP